MRAPSLLPAGCLTMANCHTAHRRSALELAADRPAARPSVQNGINVQLLKAEMLVIRPPFGTNQLKWRTRQRTRGIYLCIGVGHHDHRIAAIPDRNGSEKVTVAIMNFPFVTWRLVAAALFEVHG